LTVIEGDGFGMANGQSEVRYFEVNLISDQVSVLLRRRAFQQLSGVAAAVMIVIGTFLAVLMFMHLTTALRMKAGTRAKIKEVGDLQSICSELDQQREEAKKSAETVAPLLPIARQRIAWAPKLAAAAGALLPGTGILNLQATQRDVFIRSALNAKASIQDEAGLPQIGIAILCAPTGGADENLGAFAERLKNDQTFMEKFDSVHLIAMEQDTWEGKAVEVLHVHAQGTPK
jgi:hypothetical protein